MLFAQAWVNFLARVQSKRSTATKMASSSDRPHNSSKAAFIFLHGLGDQGSSWHMELSSLLPAHIKCICPTAPNMSVTLNMGMRMNSWFDLRSLNPEDPEDEPGIEAACKRIHELIADQEKQGVASERIMLGGFSQGGALALYSALRYPKRLAGVVALSCWLPLHRSFPAAAQEPNKSIPIIQCHGDSDFVVPYVWGLKTHQVLSSFVDKTHYSMKEYPGLGHSSSTQELRDVLHFVNSYLPR